MKTKTGIFILLLIISATINTTGQETIHFLPGYDGHAIYKYNKLSEDYEYSQQYSQKEENSIKTKLGELNKYLQINPLISKPKGNELFLTSRLSDKPTQKWMKSLLSEMDVLLSPWYMKEGKPACDLNAYKTGFSIKINNPLMAFYGRSPADSDNTFDENGLVYYIEPISIGEQDGCKLYENGIVLITNGKPLWTPVTVIEYDKALIRKIEQEIKARPEEAFALQQIMKIVKDEMASFSTTELNSPAVKGNNFGGTPLNAEEKSEGAIVKINTAYFDNSKPHTAIQLIVIECDNFQNSETGDYYFTDEYSTYPAIQLAELMKSLRYSEFKKLLD